MPAGLIRRRFVRESRRLRLLRTYTLFAAANSSSSNSVPFPLCNASSVRVCVYVYMFTLKLFFPVPRERFIPLQCASVVVIIIVIIHNTYNVYTYLQNKSATHARRIRNDDSIRGYTTILGVGTRRRFVKI